VVERVFRTLAQPEMSRLFWRAHRPMIANPQGTVLPPISTEIGNAMLRICAMVEESFGAALFALGQPALRRYADWLLSRRVHGRAKNATDVEVDFAGWHSDHVLAADTVHLWMTAHTVLFLHDYTAFLRRHVRRLSRFSVASVADCRKEAKNKSHDCEKELQVREPLANVNAKSVYRATDRLLEDFIRPWQKREPKSFAMLLYGPPGTGKTSFAKLLAGALGWDLVQLSPSDFVRGGEAAVEEHAKAVFQALEQMSTAVVLFDEIDRLLLDRDAKAYNTQGDVFQFMTPGMLTKINDLGAKKRLIFIISTNYAERIDGAIKRSGRIDRQYLWLPPDAKQRRAILAMLLARSAKEALLRVDPAQKGKEDAVANSIKEHAKKNLSNGYTERMDKLVARTTFWIFKEMEKVFEALPWDKESIEKLKDGNAVAFEKAADDLLNNTTQVTPTIRLLSYKSRFRSTSGEKPRRFPYADEPYEEFLLLLFDAFCSGYEFTDQEKGELLEPFAKALQKQDLKHVRDKDIRHKLASKLETWGYKA
jgi:AAA+ superfamily predicted ATPase